MVNRTLLAATSSEPFTRLLVGSVRKRIPSLDESRSELLLKAAHVNKIQNNVGAAIHQQTKQSLSFIQSG